MTELFIKMNDSGTFTLPQSVGRIEEYCARVLKISLNSEFLSSSISYYTMSFEPYLLSRKIITENIYKDSSTSEGIYYANGCIFCPIYDYIAVSPTVAVQIDAYETDGSGNVTAIIKSGIFTLEFAPSLTGEGMMLSTVRPDVKFYENVTDAVVKSLQTIKINGEQIESYSISGRKIAIEAVGTPHLQDSAVTTIKIKNGAVKTVCLADEGVTSEKLAKAGVTEEKLAENAVTTDKISDKSVTSAKLADSSVTNLKLANYSVSEKKIRPQSVTTSVLVDGAVTPDKLDRMYITEHQSLDGYATENWVKQQNYITENQAFDGYATEEWVKNQNYITEAQVFDGYATEEWVKEQNYITEAQVFDGYATEEWVKEQNYLTEHQSLDGYATEEWVKEQNYLTEHQSLDGYATEEWVENKGYLTEDDDVLKAEDLPEKLSGFENDIAVAFVEQDLTEEQKATAIENIGAVKREAGKTLSQNDFTDDDKEKLDAALTEHQDISMKADISSLADIAFSGSYKDLSDLPETAEVTDADKANYNKAYLHSVSEHAPVNAEENVIESITVNGESAEIKDKNASFSVIGFDIKETVFVEVY